MNKSSSSHDKVSLVTSSSNTNDTKRRKIKTVNHQLTSSGSSSTNKFVELCKGNSMYPADVTKLGEY